MPAYELIDDPDGQPRPQHSDCTKLLDGLYRAEAAKLNSYFGRRLRGDDEPADYVHEVFARLASQLSRTAVQEPYRYLRRIAQNLLFERTRRLKTRTTFNHIPLSAAIEPSVPADQSARLDVEDTLKACRAALDQLPPKTSQIFLLYRVEELSYKEIGGLLGISVPTVQYHMARALAHIDAALGQE